MDEILQLFALKTSKIQNNLLDLMTTIVEYENSQRNGHQLDTNSDEVLVNKIVFQTIEEFLPKIKRNLKTLSESIDKTVAENERLTTELSQCRRRESNFERQLEEVRNLYHNLKDEMEWNKTCEEVLMSDTRQKKTQTQELIKTSDNLKTCLSLILNSSHNQRTVQSFMENEELFREFMTTIHTIFSEQISVLADNRDNRLDPNLIETICGICVNVFQCNDYSGEDIPQWIDSLIAVQTYDKRFLKSSVNALHFICFAPTGAEELQKRTGIVTLLAKCLIDTELRHEFKLKTNIVKVIKRIIDNSKDEELTLKLINEFVAIISIDSFRAMVANEPYISLKKCMVCLLSSLSHLSPHSMTED